MRDTLTAIEIQALTERRTVRAQAAELVKRGIPFRFGCGQIEIARAVAEELPAWKRPQSGPRWEQVR